MNGCTGEKVVLLPVRPSLHCCSRGSYGRRPKHNTSKWDSPQNPGFKHLCRTLPTSPRYRYKLQASSYWKKKKNTKNFGAHFSSSLISFVFILYPLSHFSRNAILNHINRRSPPLLSSVAELQREVKGQA